MSFEFLQYLPLLKKYGIPLGLFCVGLIALVAAVISFLPGKQDVPQMVDDTGNVTTTTAPTVARDIVVDVEGSVVHPGLYQIKFDGRISDAIKSAGGIDAGADSGWVTKNLNLAAKLTDGQKIYIPRPGESVAAAVDSSGQTDGMVNINSASESDLDSLPGIGQVTALKIINNRPYSDINDLVSKKIVNGNVFGEIKDKISL